jgi:hypothetical protein
MLTRSVVALAQAQDAAAADVDARVGHVLDGLEAVIEGARGDDLVVVLARGVDVVVVGREARLLELVGLLAVQHAGGDAGLHAERAHAAHHLEHLVELAAVLLGAAPRGAHAEARRAELLGLPRLLEHGVHAQQRLGLEARLVPRALRAVAAVLGARARLDGQQRGQLHRVVRLVAAMHALRAEQQLRERQVEERLRLGLGPVVADIGGALVVHRLRPRER